MIENNSANLWLSLGAFIISIVALIYTVKTFILKSGLKIRCSLSICSTVDCDNKFISSITLENIKDRATVIFKIYLRLARNVYIEIEDFSSKPLILKPFEVYYKEYDPILFYSAGDKYVKIDHLIDNKKIKRNIVLSTTDGEYKIRTYIALWDAIYTSLRNYYTIAALPQRLEYKNKSYGSKIKYLIDLKYSNGEEQVVPIHKNKKKVFVNVNFTDTSLKSSENLRKFMLKQKRDGKLSFTEIKVIDYEEAIEKKKEFYKKDPYKAETCGYFTYSVIGKIVTQIENFKLKRKNKKIQKQNKR
jgi:hypothetical protein